MHKARLVVVLGVIAVALFVAVAVFLWLQARSAKGLSLEIQVPEEVRVGMPFDMQVNVTNQSESTLENLQLAITLPEGIAFVGSAPEQTIVYRSLGSLGAGSLTQEVFKLIVVRDENSVKRLEAAVTYSPASVGARFEKSTNQTITVGEAGLALDVVLPTKVFSGEDFEVEIMYENVADIDYTDLRLIIDYPPTFTFRSATLAPDLDNREWSLGGLRSGSDNTFKVTGSLLGPDDALFDLRVRVEGRFLGRLYEIASKTGTVAISPSPLSLAVHVNEAPEYITKTNDVLNYSLTYSNNTDTALRDVVIRAQLVGEMYDFSQLITNGSFRSTDNTITWNASNEPRLATLSVGSAGMVSFQIRTKREYPIRRLSDKNFILKVDAEIESPTVPFFVASERTLGLVRLETKVQGALEVDAQALFRDANAGIVNSGPFPPRVGQPTQYTVHWKLTNFSTDVSNVQVRAFLGPNVQMTGITRTTFGTSSPTYNARTQEVTWDIPFIPATRGVVSSPVEAIFQIEAVPSSSGSYWPLVQETEVRATDAFTGLILRDTDFPLSTALPDDLTVNSSQGIVKE